MVTEMYSRCDVYCNFQFNNHSIHTEKKEIQKEGEKVDFQEEKDQESLQNTDNTLVS